MVVVRKPDKKVESSAEFEHLVYFIISETKGAFSKQDIIEKAIKNEFFNDFCSRFYVNIKVSEMINMLEKQCKVYRSSDGFRYAM